jgi:hypothetical protein
MSILHSLRTLARRVEQRFERRGMAAYNAESDPAIRGLRLQRRQSERAERNMLRTNVVESAYLKARMDARKEASGD